MTSERTVAFNDEIWKDIKGYEKLYKVSNHGRIKSLDEFENIKKIFNANKKKFYELYRDTSSWEEFDAYLRTLPNFKGMAFITEDESKLLYLLAKNWR